MPDSSLTGLSILTVEDDALLRRQIVSVLEPLGVDVTAAPDLGAARRLVGDVDFNLVLLDLNLPDGHGLSLLRDRPFSASAGVVIRFCAAPMA